MNPSTLSPRQLLLFFQVLDLALMVLSTILKIVEVSIPQQLYSPINSDKSILKCSANYCPSTSNIARPFHVSLRFAVLWQGRPQSFPGSELSPWANGQQLGVLLAMSLRHFGQLCWRPEVNYVDDLTFDVNDNASFLHLMNCAVEEWRYCWLGNGLSTPRCTWILDWCSDTTLVDIEGHPPQWALAQVLAIRLLRLLSAWQARYVLSWWGIASAFKRRPKVPSQCCLARLAVKVGCLPNVRTLGQSVTTSRFASSVPSPLRTSVCLRNHGRLRWRGSTSSAKTGKLEFQVKLRWRRIRVAWSSLASSGWEKLKFKALAFIAPFGIQWRHFAGSLKTSCENFENLSLWSLECKIQKY